MPSSHQTKPSPSFPFTGDVNVGAWVISYNQTTPQLPQTGPQDGRGVVRPVAKMAETLLGNGDAGILRGKLSTPERN